MENFFRNAITEVINNLTDDEKIALHNEYCEINNSMDDAIYNYEDIDELFSATSPAEIVQQFGNSNISYGDNWYLNGYGNATVLNDIDKIMDIDAIVNSVLDYNSYDSLDCGDIIEIYNNIDDIIYDINCTLEDEELNIENCTIEKFNKIANKVIDDYVFSYEEIEGLNKALHEYMLAN